ncbi:hypothetical protein Sant_3501 [Sodalis praecaptivus]|uniref:Uncharacterized protein n=1 Tax=Sodalis praecaptivus TaxID=1239307 RepID=W0I231_9GAMM|nr:hypothetical protein Sant_3501 [Sodalis praecaptivus]
MQFISKAVHTLSTPNKKASIAAAFPSTPVLFASACRLALVAFPFFRANTHGGLAFSIKCEQFKRVYENSCWKLSPCLDKGAREGRTASTAVDVRYPHYELTWPCWHRYASAEANSPPFGVWRLAYGVWRMAYGQR